MVVVPDSHWPAALYRTVTAFVIGTGFKEKAGTEITKPDIAAAFGYGDARAWDRHREVITALLGGCFGEGRNNRWLRRL